MGYDGDSALAGYLTGFALTFAGWFVFGWAMGSRGAGLAELWRPALAAAIVWPLYVPFVAIGLIGSLILNRFDPPK